MRNLNFLRKSERKSVGTTLALTVGSPSAHRRYSALKHLAFMLLFLLGSLNVWGDPVTIYAENFGDNGSSNTAVASATCYSASTTMFTTGHQTSVASNYSSDGKVGKNSVNPSDNSGASGNSAVWYQASTGTNTKTLFQVSNINIANYSSLALKFNLYRTNGASSSNYVTVTYKIDNGTAQTLTYTAPSSNATWTWCSGNLMGTGNSLSITFTMHTTGGFTHRIDDIALTGTASSGSTPSVSLDPDDALNFATVGVGDPAPAAQSFTITGSNMTAALSIADLTNFDYSVTGSLSPSEGSISATVTVTPKSGFTTNAEDKSETLTISGDDLDDDIELALNAEVKAKHNIIFNNGGVKTIVNASVREGETYNITETIENSLIASCTYKKFEGWTRSSSIANANVKPTLVTSVEMEDEDVDLYAVYSITSGSGSGAAVDATLFSENFGGFESGDKMEGSQSTETGNRFVYNSGSVTYSYSNGTSADTKIYEQTSAGGSSPELLVGKNNSTFTITGIPTGSANTAILTYHSNQSSNLTVSTTTENVTIGNVSTDATDTKLCSRTITFSEGAASTFNMTFTMTTSSNARLDDIEIIVATTDAGGSTTYSLDAGCAAAGQCFAPTFSPAAGTFDAAQSVELATTTDEADIYYTLDGETTPSKTSGTKYNGTPISVTQNTTIKAIAIKDGMDPSEVATGVFNIRYAQPTFSVASGDYDEAQNVTITATGADAIYYTTNGEDPTVDPANLYDGSAIAINTTGSHTIKAIAVKAGYANSSVASATYVMDLPYANIKAFIDGESAKAAANRKLESVTLSNAIISGKSGTTLYIQDETAGIMIYGLAAGDVPANSDANHSISGTIKAKYSVFSNQHEMVKQDNTHPMDLSGVTVSADPVSRPAVSEYTTLAAAYAAKPMMLVKLTGVSYDGTQYEFSGNKIYNTFGALTEKTMPETTVECDITGIVIDYNGTMELLPVFATDIVADADAADPTVNPAGGVDAENAVTAAAVEITAAAGTKVDGLASKTVDINSAIPTEVTVEVTRDFYRSVNYSCGWYKAAAAKYNINGQGATTEGEVLAKVAGVAAATAAAGDDVHVFITPNAHFHFATILVNGVAPATVTAGEEYSFSMPGEAVTIAVTWTEDTKYALTFTAGEGSGDAPAISGNEYYAGEVIQLPANTFTYDAQHKFTKWLIGGEEYAAGVDYAMPAEAMEAVAQWKEIPNFASGDWILVEDVDELTEGSYVIIAAANYDKAMKGYVSGNNCGSEDATKEGNLLSYNSNFAIYEIGENVISETTYKTFQNVASENYLFCNTGSTNTLKEQTTINASASWSVEISTAELTLGEAAITNQYASTRSIRYNSSGMFATYTSSGQTPIVLYKYHVPSLKLTYDKNAGDDVVTGMPSMGIADGDNKVTISDATPLREGYLFDGWNSNPLGGGTVYEANHEYTLTANLTIYAQWQTATAHPLSYDKDGGEGDVPAATNYYPNADVTLANAVTKDGYIFAGWEYDGNVYAAGSHFAMPNEDVVMTAKFAQGTVYTITAVDAVSAQGALEGSNATFVNTYTNNKNQMTKDNSMTLTLSGYDLYTIKALTLRMRSNAGGGKGTLSVTIGGNAVSFTTNKWYDGDHHTDSYEDIQVMLSPTRVMPGENVVIKIEASLNSLYCQSFAIEYELVLDDIRTSLSDGKWGTICPKQEVKYPSGAVFYQLTYMEQNPDNSPYKFFFDEIAEGASLEAGKPYLFIAEGEVIKGIKVGLEAADGDHAYNGFVGYLGTSNKPLASADYIFTDGGYNYYGLQNNIFKLIGSGQIVNERAYVEVSPDRAPSTTPVPMPAPGRRRLSVGAGAPQIATGLEDGELMNDGMVKKVLINGELFIIRGEKMYDATGRIVK